MRVPASVAGVAGACLLFASARLPIDKPEVVPESAIERLTPPSRDLLHVLSVEHNLAIADIVWLDAVQALGAERAWIPWAKVLRNARIVIRLDRDYEAAAFAAASALLAFGHEPSMAQTLLLEAREMMAPSWRVSFLLGYHELFVEGDLKKAAEWYREASKMKGAPPYLASLAGRIQFLTGDPTGAMKFLEEAAEELPPLAREDARWRLKALKSEPTYRAHDAACQAWRKQHPGEGLPTVDQVRGAGLSEAPATDVFGAKITFSEDCRAHSEQVPAASRSRSADEFVKHLGKAQ